MIRAAAKLCCAYPLHLQAARRAGISGALGTSLLQRLPGNIVCSSAVIADKAQLQWGVSHTQALACKLHNSTASSSNTAVPWSWAGIAASAAAVAAATGIATGSSADSSSRHQQGATSQQQYQHQHQSGVAPASHHQNGKAADQRKHAEIDEDSSWYERLQDMYHRAVLW